MQTSTPCADIATLIPAAGIGADACTRKSAVFLTHSSFTSSFRVGSHQLAKALDARGWRVLHIPTPITPAHLPLALFNSEYRRRVGAWWKPGQTIFPNTREYLPLAWVPWQAVRRSARAPDWYARTQWRAERFIRRSGFATPDLLFIDEPRFVAMGRWFRPRHRFYRSTDLYHEMSADLSLIAAEREALRDSDGFIATSQPVFEHLRGLNPRKPGIVVQNGVELDHFSRPAPEPADLKSIPSPRAVYVGSMDARFDFDAVAALARARPGLSVVLIGPAPSVVPSSLPKNLHLLGPRRYEELPAYLQHATIGLLPLTAQPANRGRSPMKIYEYAAAGLPVLASRTDELARRDLPFVFLYERHEQLAPMADALMATHAEKSRAARQSAAAMSWHSRLDEILTFARQLTPLRKSA